MKNPIIETLKFLNLTDHNDKLSLTNVLLIACIVLLFIYPTNIAAIGGVILSVFNYAHKRHEIRKAQDKDKETGQTQAIEKLLQQTDKLANVEQKLTKSITESEEKLKRLESDLIETNDKVSKSNINSAFRPK